MAPEIVEAFIDDTEDDFKYDKRCEYLFLLDLLWHSIFVEKDNDYIYYNTYNDL